LKRDLLWILYDGKHMQTFPFGLMELGDCEEQRGSARGDEEVDLSSLDFLQQYQPIPSSIIPVIVTRNEQLFLEAMHVNRSLYQEAQIYPYFYAGHFHKNAGKDLQADDEYRLVEAMSLYARAAHVASGYPYHTGCIQLNKHMTTAAMLITFDMLTVEEEESTEGDGKSKFIPRKWHFAANAVAFGSWLLGFFDSLLYWEEISGECTQFVEILDVSHKHSIGKMFSLLPLDIRRQVFEKVQRSSLTATTATATATSFSHEHSTTIPLIRCLEHGSLSYFGPTRSLRLSSDSLLWDALSKPKISITELAMVMIPRGGFNSNDDLGNRSSRRAKRPKR
jgi:hypothetical protein